MTTLLPCPVCRVGEGAITDDCVMFIWVKCRTCLWRTRDCITEAEAIEAWNTRPGDATLHLASAITTTQAAITNLAALNDLDHRRVIPVLQSAGFVHKRDSGLVAIWEYHHGAGGAVWAHLPMDRELADYATAMHRVIKVLARIKGVSELHVYLEIITPEAAHDHGHHHQPAVLSETASVTAPPTDAAARACADLGISTGT